MLSLAVIPGTRTVPPPLYNRPLTRMSNFLMAQFADMDEFGKWNTRSFNNNATNLLLVRRDRRLPLSLSLSLSLFALMDVFRNFCPIVFCFTPPMNPEFSFSSRASLQN